MAPATAHRLPSYDELPVKPGAPAGSSWGLWGDDDTLGCLNLMTPERVREAARLIRRGQAFPLDWNLGLPDPPFFGRPPLSMTVSVSSEHGRGENDFIAFNPQGSSQWDGFRHVGSNDPEHPAARYNGLPSESHGVDHWARKGLVGRAVLADVARWRESVGRPLRMDASDPVSAEELLAVLKAQNSPVRPGDILLLHFGWPVWYEALPHETRVKLSTLRAPRAPGLLAGRDMVRTLWDLHIAAVASDTATVEVAPFSAGLPPDEASGPYNNLHQHLLPLLGIPMGELWNFGPLAADCAADGRYEAFITSAPLNIRGGVSSTPSAIAIK
jgi:hypothetical protein